MLDHRHGEDTLVVVIGKLAHVLDGHHGWAGLVTRQLDLEVLGDGGDEETRQRVRRLPEHVTDQCLRDVATDREAEGGLRGHMQGVRLASRGARRCGGPKSRL